MEVVNRTGGPFLHVSVGGGRGGGGEEEGRTQRARSRRGFPGEGETANGVCGEMTEPEGGRRRAKRCRAGEEERERERA